jgi:hypothetical protein
MFGIKKDRARVISEIWGTLGKAIGQYLAEEKEANEKKRQADQINRRLLFDLVRKSRNYDELNEIIANYGDDDSVALTLALIVQAIDIRFKAVECQIKIMAEQNRELERHIIAVAASAHNSGRPRLRWTAKEKEIRSMLERGMSFTEIVNAGHGKATVSRVKAALQKQ